jgi:hypothetical protein
MKIQRFAALVLVLFAAFLCVPGCEEWRVITSAAEEKARLMEAKVAELQAELAKIVAPTAAEVEQLRADVAALQLKAEAAGDEESLKVLEQARARLVDAESVVKAKATVGELLTSAQEAARAAAVTAADLKAIEPPSSETAIGLGIWAVVATLRAAQNRQIGRGVVTSIEDAALKLDNGTQILNSLREAISRYRLQNKGVRTIVDEAQGKATIRPV